VRERERLEEKTGEKRNRRSEKERKNDGGGAVDVKNEDKKATSKTQLQGIYE